MNCVEGRSSAHLLRKADENARELIWKNRTLPAARCNNEVLQKLGGGKCGPLSDYFQGAECDYDDYWYWDDYWYHDDGWYTDDTWGYDEETDQDEADCCAWSDYCSDENDDDAVDRLHRRELFWRAAPALSRAGLRASPCPRQVGMGVVKSRSPLLVHLDRRGDILAWNVEDVVDERWQASAGVYGVVEGYSPIVRSNPSHNSSERGKLEPGEVVEIDHVHYDSTWCPFWWVSGSLWGKVGGSSSLAGGWVHLSVPAGKNWKVAEGRVFAKRIGDLPPQVAVSDVKAGRLFTVKRQAYIYASATSRDTIGEVPVGDFVKAAGPVEVCEGIIMVPIEADGAVEISLLLPLPDLVLTLHFGEGAATGLMDVAATNIGGDEVVCVQADLGESVLNLRNSIAQELDGGIQPIHLVLPDGTSLRDDGAILGDVLQACLSQVNFCASFAHEPHAVTGTPTACCW